MLIKWNQKGERIAVINGKETKIGTVKIKDD